MEILEVLRIIFGSVFVLFLPGLVWTFVFFDRDEIDVIERVALSFGLSIALVPLVVFYLNFGFGLKISFVNTSLTILGLIATGIVLYAAKKMRKAKRNITALKP